MGIDEYRIQIIIGKANDGHWWDSKAIYQNVFVSGLTIDMIRGGTNWNRIINKMLEKIEDEIKTERDKLKQTISIDKE